MQRTQQLEQRLGTLEERHRELDEELRSALGEILSLLRDFGRSDELTRRPVEKESALLARIELLEQSLANSELNRQQLNKHLVAAQRENTGLALELQIVQQTLKAFAEGAKARIGVRASDSMPDVGDREPGASGDATAATGRSRQSDALAPQKLEPAARLSGPTHPDYESVAMRNRLIEAALTEARAETARLGDAAAEREAGLHKELTVATREQELLAARLAFAETTLRDLEAELDSARAEAAGCRQVERLMGRTTDPLRLRQGPGRSFESLKVLPVGAAVTVLQPGEAWHRVRSGNDEGWVHGASLVFDHDEIAELRAAVDASRLEVRRIINQVQIVGRTIENANLLQQPSSQTIAVSLLPSGAELEVRAWENGWFRVVAGDVEGWISSEQIELMAP